MAATRRLKKPDLGYHDVSKLTVIARLKVKGKFDEALAILKANDYDYEMWSSAPVIRSNNKKARALIKTIGLDPEVILAKEQINQPSNKNQT